MARKLEKEILEILSQRTGKEKSTIRSKISRKKQRHPTLTSNAAAHLIAQEYNTSVLQKLDIEDKESLKGIQNQTISLPPVKRSITKSRSIGNSQKKLIINYSTSNYFIKEHIIELSKAYHAKCYTCVFIFFRKILENLIIDILRAKFPSRRELVFNISQGRYHDFSIILDNLYKERKSFSIDGKDIIKRLHQLVKPFKKDANDKTHSWFHIVKSVNEVDQIGLENIIELIKILEVEVSIREKI